MVVSRIERFSASENMCTFLKPSEGAISATKVLGSFRKMFCEDRTTKREDQKVSPEEKAV